MRNGRYHLTTRRADLQIQSLQMVIDGVSQRTFSRLLHSAVTLEYAPLQCDAILPLTGLYGRATHVNLLQLARAPPAVSIDRTPVHRVRLSNVHSMGCSAIYGPASVFSTAAARCPGCRRRVKSVTSPDTTRHTGP